MIKLLAHMRRSSASLTAPYCPGVRFQMQRQIAWCFAVILLLGVAEPAVAGAVAGCPNEEARVQNNSTNLADCRAYERVSPANKNGSDITEIDKADQGGVVQATPSGNKIAYVSLTSFDAGQENPAGAPDGSQYISENTGLGWSTQNVAVALHSPETAANQGTPYKAFNEDLTEGLLTYIGHHEEAPLPGGPGDVNNLYIKTFASGAIQPLLTTPPESEFGKFELQGDAATPDLSHVVVKATGALTPGAFPVEYNLYEWNATGLQAVNVPPNPVVPGETLPTATLGFGAVEGNQDRTVSKDGSRVFWTSAAEFGQNLYVREGLGTAQPKTVELDSNVGGGGVFLTASSDGTRVFFTRGNGGGGFSGTGDLYEYNLETEEEQDLTPTSHPEEAQVQGILGASEDGTSVYFVAAGGFDGATSECCNLYLWNAHSGLTYVAKLSNADSSSWSPELNVRTARVSADGNKAVFVSSARLTGYENAGQPEVYRYEVGQPGVICVSCNPSGEPPLGSATITAGSDYSPRQAIHTARVLSDNGNRVFFESTDVLSPTDTNGVQDVYEWEKDGEGTCGQAQGCISLISGGTSSEASSFMDASGDGSNAFFVTRQQLAAGDTDQEVDLYDAREEGGIATTAAPVCSGTGCQGTPAAPPVFAIAPTETFSGVGNFPPPPKVVVPKLTRAQELTKALRTCAKKKSRKQRASCEKTARKKYAPPKKTKKK
jgi:hypothetical protein